LILAHKKARLIGGLFVSATECHLLRRRKEQAIKIPVDNITNYYKIHGA